jgi:hypothetical protein
VDSSKAPPLLVKNMKVLEVEPPLSSANTTIRIIKKKGEANEKSENALVMNSRENYKISVLIGIDEGPFEPMIAVLDTGAGPNLIRVDVLPKDWKARQIIINEPKRRIQDANGNHATALATVRLACTVGTLETQAIFWYWKKWLYH